jgi:plasmid stability protein
MTGMPPACYGHPMANLQVKNVPEPLHQKLRRCAKRRGQTVGEVVLEAVRRELSHEEFVARMRRRRPVDLGRPAAALLREARAERETAR